ncbi:hypothetical protein FM076_32945 [Streptomyces albus subsp. chlorinus]|nr:hypothetical protein [Streptomyces albus subsp. chlorinus]
MNGPTGVQLNAAHAHVTVRSNTPAVTDWSHRYFGPWWNATHLPTPTATGPGLPAGKAGAGPGQGVSVLTPVVLLLSAGQRAGERGPTPPLG